MLSDNNPSSPSFHHNPKKQGLLSGKRWESTLRWHGVMGGRVCREVGEAQSRMHSSWEMLGEGGDVALVQVGQGKGWRYTRTRGDLPEWQVTFHASFSFEFACGKPARKVTSGNHVTAGGCNVVNVNLLPSIKITITWLVVVQWPKLWSLAVTITCSAGLQLQTLTEQMAGKQRLPVNLKCT